MNEARGIENLAGRDRALALHKAGRIVEAIDAYETILRAEPANADILGLLSVAQLRLGQEKKGLASWRKSLALEKTVPGRLRNIANFLLAMQQMDEVRSLQPGYEGLTTDFLDGLEIPDWPQDLPLDKAGRSVIVALAQCLVDFNHRKEALRLLDSALAGLSGDPDFLAVAIPVMLEAGDAEKALALLQPLTAESQRDNGALLIAHAAAAAAMERAEEAQALSRRAREAVPVYLSRKMPNQRMLIGVLSPEPKIITRAFTPFVFHFNAATPATLVSKMNDEFRFLSIFPQSQSTAGALAALPRPQIIINNWVNAEVLTKPDTLDFISAYADSFGVPVINHPRRAAVTTRQHNAERLAGIPNVIVPRVLRIINEPEKRGLVVRVVEEKVGFPVIIRNTFGQKGWETAKIETAAELSAYLANAQDPQLYAIEYFHNTIAEGAHRKIRAAVIGGELFVLHVHFGAQWNVHRAEDRRGLTAFDTGGTATAFAQEILKRPEAALGKPAMEALREIRNRTPLDIYGIDFNLMPDGRILFFEANAAMHISMREREDLPETRLAMRKAYRRLFENPPPGPSAAANAPEVS
ncbi:hypothetical protein [Taklimakanibacter lacteus]|uniref:hypothetical protein n=1 Tax=Taklimakanibacter lacteus TaxID=2268456 RepID=UPI0013C4B23E